MAVPPILAIKSTKKIRKIISFTLSNVVQAVVVGLDGAVAVAPAVAFKLAYEVDARIENKQARLAVGRQILLDAVYARKQILIDARIDEYAVVAKQLGDRLVGAECALSRRTVD